MKRHMELMVQVDRLEQYSTKLVSLG